MAKENVWFVGILRLQVSILLKWSQCYLCNTLFQETKKKARK